MFILCRKRRPKPNCSWILFILLFIIVIFNEYIVYIINSYQWPNIECGESKQVYKVLLVADPQILGENTESWIARWDSDRYLSNTFHMALNHLNPSLVIFLGDLMDEGSVATNSQFSRYFKRFQRIYSLDKIKNKTLYLPGDNDIGGEGDDLVTPEKIERFKNHFNQPDTFSSEGIVFFKVNHMIRTYPDVDINDPGLKVRIALSHIPMMDMPSWFMRKAMEKLKPHFILSAHDHKSMHFVGNQNTGERLMLEEFDNNKYYIDSQPGWRFQVSNQLANEMIVPTCSYRMGTQEIGLAYAIIDAEKGVVCYNIMWLPKRLYFLIIYLCFLVLFIIFSILCFIRRKCICRRSRLPL